MPIRIYIKPGEYFEKLIVPANKTHIHFIGADKNTTVINYDDYSGKELPNGVNLTTGTSYTVLVRGDDFYAQDITFLNSAGTIAQAVALHVVADRVVINGCNIIANQVNTLSCFLKVFDFTLPTNIRRTRFTQQPNRIVRLDNTIKTVSSRVQRTLYLAQPLHSSKTVS